MSGEPTGQEKRLRNIIGDFAKALQEVARETGIVDRKIRTRIADFYKKDIVYWELLKIKKYAACSFSVHFNRTFISYTGH